MSNNTEWRPIAKFPGYELSATELIRNSRTKRIVPQRIEPFDILRRKQAILIRMERPVEVFVAELMYATYPERRVLVSKF